MNGLLTATFTRRPAQPDLVHVVRTDGTETEWDFPNRGDALPPDSFSPPTSGDTMSHLGFRLPDGTTAETINAIQIRLRELTEHWRQRQDQSITLAWRRGGNWQSPIR